MKKIIFVLLLLSLLTLAACKSDNIVVKFDTNEQVNVKDITLKEGDDLILPEPVVKGHTLTGWYYDSEFTDKYSQKDIISGDLTLYGKFVINEFKITVKSTNGDNLLVINKDYGYELSNLVSYGFATVYLDSDLSTLLSNETLGDSDITLYVEYVKNKKIGVILPDKSEARWALRDGLFFYEHLSALGEGYEFEILYSDGNESIELNNVIYFIENDFDVIILTTQGSGAAALAEANEAGIPIISHDRLSRTYDSVTSDFYTTFNAWEVGKAMGKYLVDEAFAEGCNSSQKCDLALFSGRTADWPNATYFFGGAFEELQPHLNIFNIVNANPNIFYDLDLYTEDTFDNEAKNALQSAMITIDTDWNPEQASYIAENLISQLNKTSDSIFILAPADFVSANIREEFAKMLNPYNKMFITGQDGTHTTIASLLGDYVNGRGMQTMTVYKDISKLCAASVAIAKNIVDGLDGDTGLISTETIDGTINVYASIDVLTFDNPQHIYDLLFATGYYDKQHYMFDNIDFSQYE